jgi:hypothetical protein
MTVDLRSTHAPTADLDGRKPQNGLEMTPGESEFKKKRRPIPLLFAFVSLNNLDPIS